MDLVCQVMRDDKETLFILGLDNYNNLFASNEIGSYNEGSQTLEVFCNAFGYITAVSNTICLFSGTKYRNMRIALLGFNYI